MIGWVVSGGQTGADRAALEAARDAGIETGGWVHLRGRAEDGALPDCYPNTKGMCSAVPAIRTRCDVIGSDDTAIFHHGNIFGGTRHTMEAVSEFGKTLLCLDLSKWSAAFAATRLLDWVTAEGVEVLKVAGPRQTEDRNIYSAVRAVLARAFRNGLSLQET